MKNLDPANIKPGEHPPVPQSEHDLIVESLRFANRVSVLLNDLTREVSELGDAEGEDPRIARLHEMLLRKYSDCSGLHLFIAASNLDLELPPDLREVEGYDEEWDG